MKIFAHYFSWMLFSIIAIVVFGILAYLNPEDPTWWALFGFALGQSSCDLRRARSEWEG